MHLKWLKPGNDQEVGLHVDETWLNVVCGRRRAFDSAEHDGGPSVFGGADRVQIFLWSRIWMDARRHI